MHVCNNPAYLKSMLCSLQKRLKNHASEARERESNSLHIFGFGFVEIVSACDEQVLHATQS